MEVVTWAIVGLMALAIVQYIMTGSDEDYYYMEVILIGIAAALGFCVGLYLTLKIGGII